MQLAASAFAVLNLGGCATAVNEGNLQSVSIDSDPQGAYCFLDRNETRIGGVATPGVVSIKRDQHTVQVLCSKQGYQDGEGYLVAELDPWMFGNVLTVGVGAVVDIGSGAASLYEPTVTVTLVPYAFESPEAKQDFHQMMQARIDAKAKELLDNIVRECPREQRCEEKIQKLREEKWQAMERLRIKMRRSVVTETS